MILKILKPWSDSPYVGLTGVEVYGKEGRIQIKSIKAEPADMNSMHGVQGDKRVATNLINNYNQTTNEAYMWMIPFTSSSKSHVIQLNLEESQPVTSIRIWNYNKSHEDSFRGVKYL